MAAIETKRCSKAGCNKEIYWLVNEKTEKKAPIDAMPDPNGNLVVNLPAGTYRVVGPGEGQYVNHFATCLFAREFAKR
jgi:hypothetical protein